MGRCHALRSEVVSACLFVLSIQRRMLLSKVVCLHTWVHFTPRFFPNTDAHAHQVLRVL